MAKKLTVEVDADVSKAKRKIRGELGGSVPPSSGPEDAAAKSIRNLGKSAETAHRDLSGMAKAFVGIASSMAMSYAAKHMEQGAARDAVEYGANIIGGAAAGAMAGKVGGGYGMAAGAVIGGVGGAVKTYLDKDAEKENYMKEFREAENLYQNSLAWQAKLRELTEAMRPEPIQTILDNLRNAERTHKANAQSRAEAGQYDAATDSRRALAETRSRIQQLEAMQRAMQKAKSPRESIEAVDALSRIGGGRGGGDFAREQLNVQREMAGTLKSIDQKTRNGGSTWQ